MSLLGIHLTLLIGPNVAVPVPPPVIDALQSVEVTHRDDGRSGFQIVFQSGRSGAAALLDFPLLANPLLKPMNRVIVIVTFSATPRVLMDGVITDQQLTPGGEPGASTLTITGEDVSVMMDLEEKSVEHPAQSENIIATKLIASYAQYGLVPMVIPPLSVDTPSPTERVPVQQGTDLQYLTQLAGRCAYVFFVKPGPAPAANIAYWGPPVRVGVPQRALSLNMGAESNVDSLSFRHNALAPTLVSGKTQERSANQSVPVQTFASTRPPLASRPTLAVNQPNVRRAQFREGGLNAAQALSRAQAITDAASDAVNADGELDALRYGELLEARGLVGLRGAGLSYDGLWYVRRVSHTIRKGAYKQRFTLAREGVGATVPAVRP